MSLPQVNLVSLYSLQRETGVHRDTLELLCRRQGIPITYARVSTPRYLVRQVAPGDAEQVKGLAARRRNRERLCAASTSGRRRGITSGSTIAAAV